MGVTYIIQCGGVREMKKLTNEELVKYAEAIKDFCECGRQDCDDCPFHNDDHKLYWEDRCALGVPVRWDIEKRYGNEKRRTGRNFKKSC